MGYPQLLRSQHASGTLLNTYTTAKSVINSQAITPIPPGLLQLGDILRIRASMGISNVVTAQPTFTFQMMMGAAQPSSIIAHTSQACLTTTTAHTTIWAKYEVLLRLDSEGSGTAAKFMGLGELTGIMFPISGAVADPTASVGTVLCPATGPALGTGWDSTVLNYLDFFVGISVSNGGNGIQVQKYSVELLSERN